MATAGERYTERTGNIWSYAHRNDMTGLRAALHRGVDVNLTNTVGWTACHAAAAGGSTKALRHLIAKHGADLTIADRGGSLPCHHAAKNGHVHALRLLQEFGDDITKVRLSQCKGKAVRDEVIQAYRKVNKNEYDSADEDKIVGYERKQSKSTAFWGPRRTPISAKIKKKIIKSKRLKKKDKTKDGDGNSDGDGGDHGDEDDSISIKMPDDRNREDSRVLHDETELSYQKTVQLLKRNNQRSKKQKRRHQRKIERELQKEIDFHAVSNRENKIVYEERRTEEYNDEYQDLDTSIRNVTSGFASLMTMDSDSSIDSNVM